MPPGQCVIDVKKMLRYEYLGPALLLLAGMLLLGMLINVCIPDLSSAWQPIPGEGRNNIFYIITHLHPFAYLILFLVLALSVLNLVYQGRASVASSSSSSIHSLRRRIQRILGRDVSEDEPKPLTVRSPGKQELTGKGAPSVPTAPEEGVITTRKATKEIAPATGSRSTPLNGINHPLPTFSGPAEVQTGRAQALADNLGPKPEKRRFRFTAAVDLPSPEEIQKRDKEKLVVIGTVKGPDGKGIPSVLVFLTDEHGNRLGQSARTMKDTGEFKVQANEPGLYLVSAHKRGFVVENTEPLVVPQESGRVEGFRVRMRPEGCLVHGRLLFGPAGVPVGETEIRCVVQSETIPRSAKVGHSGAFRIPGVPLSNRCFIEVLGKDGEILTRSEVIETGTKKHIYREIKVPAAPKASEFADQADTDTTIPWTPSEKKIDRTLDTSFSTTVDRP